MDINPAMLLGGVAWRDSRKRRKVRITGGIRDYVGMVGEVLEPDEGGSHRKDDTTIRVAFENFGFDQME